MMKINKLRWEGGQRGGQDQEKENFNNQTSIFEFIYDLNWNIKKIK